MPRLTSLTVALLTIIVPASAQEPDGKAVQVPWANKMFVGMKETPPPVIVQNFGVVKKGTVKSFRFELTNIYAVPLEIQEPVASSSCLSVKEVPSKLGPNEAGSILVEIDTSKFDGRKAVKLPVFFRGMDPKTDKVFYSTAQLEVWAISK